MKVKEWSQRIFWFVFGAMFVGVFMFISTSFGKITNTASSTDIESRVTSLESRATNLESELREVWKEMAKKENSVPPCRGKNCD